VAAKGGVGKEAVKGETYAGYQNPPISPKGSKLAPDWPRNGREVSVLACIACCRSQNNARYQRKIKNINLYFSDSQKMVIQAP